MSTTFFHELPNTSPCPRSHWRSKSRGPVGREGLSGTKLIKSLANPLSNASLPKLLRRLITESALDLIELVVGHNRVLLQLVLPIRFSNISS